MENNSFTARSWSIGSARAVFSSIADGNLALHTPGDKESVLANRKQLEQEVGKRILFANQVHSADVCVVQTDSDVEAVLARAPSVDAFVTNRKDIALAMMVADCIPLLLVDPIAEVIAAVHAGRRGVISKIASNAITEMLGLGAEVSRIEAITGPSICGSCYEVTKEMQAQLQECFPEIVSTTSWDTPGLDLKAALYAELKNSGLTSTNISISPYCTLEEPDYFSYREDQAAGRFAGLIWLA